MKLFAFALAAIPAVLSASYTVSITRPNGEKATIGPGVGCFGTKGPVSKVEIPQNALVVFYSEYNCQGSITYDRLAGSYTLESPLTDVKSIEIIDLLNEKCSA